MFERFTDPARHVIVLAQEEAKSLGHGYIGTEHLLLGLVREGEGLAARALESLGIGLAAARAQVRETAGPATSGQEGQIPFTPRAKKVLELSLREALHLRHNYIGTEHILLGMVHEGEAKGFEVLAALGVTPDQVRERVLETLREMPPEGVAAAAEPPGGVFGRRPRDVGNVAVRLDQLLGRLDQIEKRIASIEHQLRHGQEPAGPQSAHEPAGPQSAREPPPAPEPPAAPEPPGPGTGHPPTGTG